MVRLRPAPKLSDHVPVATPTDLLESPQLAARGFFRDVDVAGRRVTVPGPPYRFADLDVGPRSSAR